MEKNLIAKDLFAASFAKSIISKVKKSKSVLFTVSAVSAPSAWVSAIVHEVSQSNASLAILCVSAFVGIVSLAVQFSSDK